MQKKSRFTQFFESFFGLNKPKEEVKPETKAMFIIQRLTDKYCKNKKGKCKGRFGKPAWMRGLA